MFILVKQPITMGTNIIWKTKNLLIQGRFCYRPVPNDPLDFQVLNNMVNYDVKHHTWRD